MDKGVLTVTESVAALQAVKTADFDGGKLCLIKTNLPIGRDSDLATLVAAKADFSGYADKTIATWFAAFRDSSGNSYLEAPSQDFAHNGGGTNNVIYGWYYTNAAGTVLLAGGIFANPPSLTPLSNALVVAPTVLIPPQVQ